MGPFITAYVRTNGSTTRARERAKELLGPLQDHLSDAGLGHISEIVDAESPHAPRGCIAQAWSVAEILRAAVEDVFAVKPTPKRQNAVHSLAKWLNSRRGGHSKLYPVCQDPWIRNSPFPLSRETTAKSSAQGNKRTRSRDIMLRCLGDSFFDLIGDLIMDQNFPLRSVVVPAYAPEVQGNPGFPALIPNRQIGDGRYVARFAHTKEELFAALKLRFEVFNLELGEGLQASFLTGRDIDEFDEQCHHLIVVDTENQDRVVGTYRMQTSEMARAGRGFYSNVEFELSTLPPEVLSDSIELGRACVAQDHRNTAVLFLLWRGLAAYLMHNRKRYLFGCCSLTSQDPLDGLRVMHLLERNGQIDPSFKVTTQPGFECLAQNDISVDQAVRLPKLFQIYMRYGARVCSRPALDRQFKTIDFLVLFDVQKIDEQSRKLFFADQGGE